MENQLAKNWYMLLIKGIIMVILAIFVLVNPEGTLKAVAFYLGIGFLISGILLFIRHVPGKSEGAGWNRNRAEGVADLVIGLLLVAAPMLMVAIIPFLIGIWAAYYGVLIIIDSFKGQADGALKLISGDTLEGYIKSFDNFSILLEVEGDVLVYKHAVASLTSTDGQFRLHQ